MLMKKKPFFSVIIPTLNEEIVLPRLLDSLLSQTYKDFEVIVSDGPSRDKTKKIALTYEKKFSQFQYIRSEKSGVSHQRNVGANHASGQWYVFVDADSVLFPYALSRVFYHAKQNDRSLFTAWFQPDSSVTADVLFSLIELMYVEGSQLIKKPILPGIFVVVNHKAFRDIGRYDESIMFGEDFDFSQKAKKKGFSIQIIRETLLTQSFRRVRKEGKLKYIRLYAQASLIALVTGRGLKKLPGYDMLGGQFYIKGKTSSRLQFLRKKLTEYEKALKKIVKETL